MHQLRGFFLLAATCSLSPLAFGKTWSCRPATTTNPCAFADYATFGGCLKSVEFRVTQQIRRAELSFMRTDPNGNDLGEETYLGGIEHTYSFRSEWQKIDEDQYEVNHLVMASLPDETHRAKLWKGIASFDLECDENPN